MALRVEALCDGLLDGRDLGFEEVAVGEALIPLGGDGGDRSVHFRFFRGFFGEGMIVGCGFVAEDLDVAALHFLILLQLGHFHPELVALFEDALATFDDEVVEAVGESCHAIAQFIEAEVDAGKGVGHRWGGGGVGRAQGAGREGGLEHSAHGEVW